MLLTSIRLPEALARELDAIATRRRTPRSEVIREAIEQYCATARGASAGDRIALVRQLVTYRGSGRGDLAARSEEYLRERFHGVRRRRRPG
jgi:metal-responsive CopG/Arc/MetJ family transcriptional regulator